MLNLAHKKRGRGAMLLELLFVLSALAQPETTAPSNRDASVPAAVAAQPPAQTSCELHVWPAGDLRSVTIGWANGGINDGAVSGREGYQRLPSNPLDLASQRAVLAAADLANRLGLPQHRVVIHETPLDSVTIRTTAGRLETAGAPCYAELVVDDIFFQKDVVSGRFLRTLFRFRDFGSGPTPVRSHGTFTRHRLENFPPVDASMPAQLDAALAELRSVYAASIQDFSIRARAAGPATRRN